MSVGKQSLSLCIKGLECEGNTSHLQPQPNEVFCEILKNSQSILQVSLNALNTSPALIPEILPRDEIQLIFKRQSNHEVIGCISFDSDLFVKEGQGNLAQWITLFEDPEDDLFDGTPGVDDEELPRIYVDFKAMSVSPSLEMKEIQNVKKSVAGIQQDLEDGSNSSQSENIDNDDDQSDLANYKLPTEHGSVERVVSPRFDTENDDIQEPVKIEAEKEKTVHENDEELLQAKIEDFIETLSVGKTKSVPLRSKKDFENMNMAEKETNEFEDSMSCSSLLSVQGEEGDNPVKILKKDFAKEIALLSDKLQQANDLAKSAKDLRELIAKKNAYEPEKKTPLQRIQTQENRAESEETKILKEQNVKLNKKIQELTKKNESLNKENEVLKSNEGVYTEKLCKVKMELEKMKLSRGGHDQLINELQGKLEEAQSQIKDDVQAKIKLIKEKEKLSLSLQNIQDEYQLIKKGQEENIKDQFSRNQVLLKEKEDLREENQRLREAIQSKDGSSKEQKGQIEKLQEEILKLRTERQALEILNASPSESNHTNQGNDKILITSLLSQIEDLKNHIQNLEVEKYGLKDELFKSNDNYTKLTSKYIELTEVISGLRQSSRLLNTSRSRTPKREPANSSYLGHEADNVDDVESKMNEFIQENRIAKGTFIRHDRNTYLLNNKRISLKVANGRLLIREGASFLPFEEFWKKRTNTTSFRARTPPPTLKNRQNNQSKSQVNLRRERSSYNQTPDRKTQFSPARLIKVENGAILSEERLEGLKEAKKLDEGKKTLTGDSKQKNGSMKTIDRKLVDSVYRFKGKTHRDLNPVLKTHYKQV